MPHLPEPVLFDDGSGRGLCTVATVREALDALLRLELRVRSRPPFERATGLLLLAVQSADEEDAALAREALIEAFDAFGMLRSSGRDGAWVLRPGRRLGHVVNEWD